ncbi:hypothetical protein A2U01_0060453, partial [Trifolium medium]|nr:hypothetical protein [Trifolium medium]
SLGSQSSDQDISTESIASYGSEEQVLKAALPIIYVLKLMQDSEGFKLHQDSNVTVSSTVLL